MTRLPLTLDGLLRAAALGTVCTSVSAERFASHTASRSISPGDELMARCSSAVRSISARTAPVR